MVEKYRDKVMVNLLDNKEIVKRIKIVAKDKGYTIDKFYNTANSFLSYKVVDGIYKYFEVYSDMGMVTAYHAISRVVIYPRYPYGDVDSLYIKMFMHEKLQKTYGEGRYPLATMYLLNESIPNSRVMLFNFRNDFDRALELFEKDVVPEYLNNKIVEHKVEYLKGIVKKFNDNNQFQQYSLEEFHVYLKNEYRNKIEVKMLLSAKDYKQLLAWTSASEMRTKTFEKRLKNVSPEAKDKFMMFFEYETAIKTGDLHIDRMIGRTEERGSFGAGYAHLYSTFMTFVEKAY